MAMAMPDMKTSVHRSQGTERATDVETLWFLSSGVGRRLFLGGVDPDCSQKTGRFGALADEPLWSAGECHVERCPAGFGGFGAGKPIPGFTLKGHGMKHHLILNVLPSGTEGCEKGLRPAIAPPAMAGRVLQSGTVAGPGVRRMRATDTGKNLRNTKLSNDSVGWVC